MTTRLPSLVKAAQRRTSSIFNPFVSDFRIRITQTDAPLLTAVKSFVPAITRSPSGLNWAKPVPSSPNNFSGSINGLPSRASHTRAVPLETVKIRLPSGENLAESKTPGSFPSAISSPVPGFQMRNVSSARVRIRFPSGENSAPSTANSCCNG